jgi:hypothetical protein
LEALVLEKQTILDKLAGITVARRYPKVEALVNDGFSRAKLKGIESHNLYTDDAQTILGGTVFALHNSYFSAEWIAAYLVETDNNCFMEDKQAKIMFD